MRIFGLDVTWARKAQAISLDTLIRRLEMAVETVSGIQVTPDNAMQSPTVHAIVKAIGGRISTLPVHVLQSKKVNDRMEKEVLPNHPVAKLLSRPNDFQDRVTYWLDATSWLVRYGRYYAFKARGTTGPIRRLEPLPPSSVTPQQDEELIVTYKVQRASGDLKEYTSDLIHHARGPARDGFTGDSPVMDARESIALEMAAERFGASFFGNGAMPSLVFQYAAASQGHKTVEDRQKFIDEFKEAYSGRGRFRAVMLPRGIEMSDPIMLDNDKAQFLQTRMHQRTVIAGAFGVPPHLVGDLQRATFSNVEQQSLDFIQAVILPYVRIFEASMERDLLTAEDRAGGIIIRFNLDGALRGDFKTRQEGLKIQRELGVISANDWREREGLNPISEEDGGDIYYQQGPSGQTGPTGGGNDPPPEPEPGNQGDPRAGI